MPSRQLLLATSNPGKILEMKECLSGIPIALLALNDLPERPLPPLETGSSHTENARLKAEYYFAHTNIPTIAEDSGIHVEALEGELGVETRRFGAGPEATDKEWITYFLERMKREKNKRAAFHSVIALACSKEDVLCHAERSEHERAETKHDAHDVVVHTFEGRCEGVITESLEAPYLPGLPVSSCFKPDGYSAVFSALSIEQKNYTSHRGKAMKKLREFLGHL